MADRVRFILDRMSVLFRQLEETELFSKDEVKSIVKRTTDFEYLMCRRELTVSDVVGYLKYEINLDKLRTLRSTKLIKAMGGQDDNKEKKSALQRVQSAFIGHITYIFDRVIRRFSTNIDLWIEYISFLESKSSTNLLNAAFGRVLSLHPKCEEMWIKAAIHELDKNGNAHASRVLFQRSLRANKTSQLLWYKYFEFEVWNGARIGDRKRLLELQTDNTALLGAPMVVLSHAMQAVGDVPFACRLHQCASIVSNALRHQVEEQLKSVIGKDPLFWKYLIAECLRCNNNSNTTTDDVHDGTDLTLRLYDYDISKNRTFAEACKGSGIQIIDGSMGMIKEAMLILSEASSHVIDNGDLVVNALHLVVLRLSNDVRQFAAHLSHEDSKKSINGLEQLLREVDRLIIDISGQLDNAVTATTGRQASRAALVRHHIWLLYTALNRPSPLPDIKTGDETPLLSPADATEFIITHSSGYIIGLVKSNHTTLGLVVDGVPDSSIGTTATWVDEIKEFCYFADELLNTSVRLFSIMEKSTNEAAGKLIEDVCKSISPTLHFVICCDVGIQLSRQVIRALTIVGKYTDCVELFKLLLKSSHCKLGGLRTYLGSSFLRFVVLHYVDITQEEILKGCSTNGSMSPLLTQLKLEVLPDHRLKFMSTFAWIQQVYIENPSFIVQEDRQPMLDLVIQFERNHISLSTTSHSSKVLQLLLEDATKCCPGDANFWDSLENVERENGNFKQANHIRWKRSQQV